MCDKEFLLEILCQIEKSINTILRRVSLINKPDDFIKGEEGLEKLDSVCMQLIAIGEALKQIDKVTEGKFLSQYSEVEWNKAKRMRDVIAHHYFDVDEEIAFVVCKEELPKTLNVIRKMKNDISDIKEA